MGTFFRFDGLCEIQVRKPDGLLNQLCNPLMAKPCAIRFTPGSVTKMSLRDRLTMALRLPSGRARLRSIDSHSVNQAHGKALRFANDSL